MLVSNLKYVYEMRHQFIITKSFIDDNYKIMSELHKTNENQIIIL